MRCSPFFADSTPLKFYCLEHFLMDRNSIHMLDWLLTGIRGHFLWISSGSSLIPIPMIAVPVLVLVAVSVLVSIVAIRSWWLCKIAKAAWSSLAVLCSTGRWPSDLSRHHLALAVMQPQVQHILP